MSDKEEEQERTEKEREQGKRKTALKNSREYRDILAQLAADHWHANHERLKLSQSQVADDLKIKAPSINNLINHRRGRPSHAKILEFIDCFTPDPDDPKDAKQIKQVERTRKAGRKELEDEALGILTARIESPVQPVSHDGILPPTYALPTVESFLFQFACQNYTFGASRVTWASVFDKNTTAQRQQVRSTVFHELQPFYPHQPFYFLLTTAHHARQIQARAHAAMCAGHSKITHDSTFYLPQHHLASGFHVLEGFRIYPKDVFSLFASPTIAEENRPEPQQLLDELNRARQPGGHVVISDLSQLQEWLTRALCIQRDNGCHSIFVERDSYQEALLRKILRLCNVTHYDFAGCPSDIDQGNPPPGTLVLYPVDRRELHTRLATAPFPERHAIVASSIEASLIEPNTPNTATTSPIRVLSDEVISRIFHAIHPHLQLEIEDPSFIEECQRLERSADGPQYVLATPSALHPVNHTDYTLHASACYFHYLLRSIKRLLHNQTPELRDHIVQALEHYSSTVLTQDVDLDMLLLSVASSFGYDDQKLPRFVPLTPGPGPSPEELDELYRAVEQATIVEAQKITKLLADGGPLRPKRTRRVSRAKLDPRQMPKVLQRKMAELGCEGVDDIERLIEAVLDTHPATDIELLKQHARELLGD